MSGRNDGQTHAEGCWGWGTRHYDCAVDAVERLRESLRFYAHPQSYGIHGGNSQRVLQDAGERARKALAGLPVETTAKFPAFLRREVERAVEAAVNPQGVSTHDGKARVNASTLQRMLAIIDGMPSQETSELERLRAAVKSVNDDLDTRAGEASLQNVSFESRELSTETLALLAAERLAQKAIAVQCRSNWHYTRPPHCPSCACGTNTSGPVAPGSEDGRDVEGAGGEQL
jgi:hypothetical protein